MKLLEMMDYCHYLNGGDCFRAFMYVKIHLIVYLQYVHFILCQLRINKGHLKMICHSELRNIFLQYSSIYFTTLPCNVSVEKSKINSVPDYF